MGAAESQPAPVYQPSFMEMHVRTAGAMHSPAKPTTPGLARQPQASSPTTQPATATAGTIGDLWCSMQAQLAAVDSQPLPAPVKSDPQYKLSPNDSKLWSHAEVQQHAKQHAEKAASPIIAPTHSGWLTGAPAATPAATATREPIIVERSSEVAGAPVVDYGGQAAAWAVSMKGATSVDVAWTMRTTSVEEAAETDADSESTRSSPPSVDDSKPPSEAGAPNAKPIVGDGTDRERHQRQQQQNRSPLHSGRINFMEHAKTLQAFWSSKEGGNGKSPAGARGGTPGGLRSWGGTVSREGTRTPRQFPWMVKPASAASIAAAGMGWQSEKDKYKMGRYDLVTANLHGAFDVVKCGDKDKVYRGIDDELVA